MTTAAPEASATSKSQPPTSKAKTAKNNGERADEAKEKAEGKPKEESLKPDLSDTAPVPKRETTIAVVERLRQQRARKLGIRFALFVVLPTLLAALYFGVIASDQFESHSVFTVHSASTRPHFGIEGLLGSVGGSATTDTLAIRDFVLSRDMLARLDKEQAFISHFQSEDIDYLSRLPADATFEEAYEYYLDKVQVEFDSTSGSLALRVRAFSPEQAKAFAAAITKSSEEMVNGLSQRERADQIRFAEVEVEKCEKRLAAARQQLLEQQQKHAELNPMHTAKAAMAIRTELEGELARARAELSAARSFMTPNAPKVLELEARVRAISGQVAAEKNRLVDPKKENGIAESMAQFESAMIEKEFAEKSYEAALAALEIARADAVRQHRYLAVVASPSAPDESTYPRRGTSVLTVFVLSFLLLGVGSLLVAAVREHARV